MRPVLCFAMLALAALVTVPLRAEGLITEDLRIPMTAAGPEGLEAVIVKPPGPGRHPLALVSHGSPRKPTDRPGLSARGMMPQLVEFARRGFVAVSVLRRGYGSSPGGWADVYGPCDHPDYTRAGRAGAEDLRTAIAFLSRRGDVDASKILAVGISAGGFATVALTADPPPGLLAAISFAGGRGSQGPDNVCGEDALISAFHAFGETSRTPMLWVYASNDHFFGPALAQKLHRAFEQAGGRATYLPVGPFGNEGHLLFTGEGRSIWTPIVDDYLKREHFPLAAARVVERPALDAPGGLSVTGRTDFQTYLDGASHKAFAISGTGGYAWRTGRSTVEEASADAIANCEKVGGKSCRLFAVDDAYAVRH